MDRQENNGIHADRADCSGSPDAFVTEGGVLKKYTGSGGDVWIPDGVQEIGDEAFSSCYDLEQVHFPDGVARIGRHAFRNCHKLAEIDLPGSVVSIGWGAFDNCVRLSRVSIPDRTDKIGRDAFRNCHSLILTVGESAYAKEYCDCYGLKYARRREGSPCAAPDAGAAQGNHGDRSCGPWDGVYWSRFCEQSHKDGDDPDTSWYDSAGYMRRGNLWGVLRNDGTEDAEEAEVIFQPQWDDCEDLGSGYSPDGGLEGAYYFVRVSRGGLSGVVDTAGRCITPCKWDEIDAYGNARQGGLWGFVNLITCGEEAPQWPENRHLQPGPVGRRFECIENWPSMFMGGTRLEWETTMVLFAARPEGYRAPRARPANNPALFENPDWAAFRDRIRAGDTAWLRSGDRITVDLANREKLRLEAGRDAAGRIFFLSLPAMRWHHRLNELGAESPEGWADTTLRRYLREEVFPLLPAGLRQAIEPVRILQVVHGRRIVCEDRLFALSRTQVFGGEHVAEPEDSQIDVFRRPDFRRKANGDPGYWWWLRSGDPDNNCFFMVRDDGPGNSRYPCIYDATANTGVVFGFCL